MSGVKQMGGSTGGGLLSVREPAHDNVAPHSIGSAGPHYAKSYEANPSVSSIGR